MEEKFEIVPVNINSDIHNHTKGSDGRQSSLRFLLRALNNNKNIAAITDHDSVRGFKNLENDLYAVVETIKDDKSYDSSKILELLEKVKILRGTELITSYNGVIIEILGYNFDVEKMEEEIQQLKSTVQEKPYEALYKGFNKIIDEKDLAFNYAVLYDAYKKIKEEGKGGVVGPFFNELIRHKENLPLLNYIDENGEEKQADSLKLFINSIYTIKNLNYLLICQKQDHLMKIQ